MSVGSVALVIPSEIDLGSWDLFELSIPATVFGMPQPDLADPWYDLRLCAVPSEKDSAPVGFGLQVTQGLDGLHEADTVIVSSVPDVCIDAEAAIPAELTAALQRAHEHGARIVSLCTGAFALAEAGLLDGRRATAHWMHTDQLAARYPQVQVDDSVLYVDEGDVLTSAGMSAGLDLCLHLVRQDLGHAVANRLARRMVVPAHRPGGQAQYIDLSVPGADDQSLEPVLQWARARLDEPLTVEDLAARAAVSPRTFYRRLHAATGTTPLQWLLHQRLAQAQSLLESTTLSVEQVAERSGLGSATNLRRHFVQQVGVAPSEYRKAFPGGFGSHAAS